MNGSDRAAVVVDGVTMAYEDRGAGRPVVFVHGLGASSRSWWRVAHLLANSYRTISLDLMGSGRSQKPGNQPYTLQRQATLLKGFLSELKLDRFALVGHSYGGGVCLSLLSREHQFTIRGLALIASICYPQRFPLWVQLLRTPLLGELMLYAAPATALVRWVLQHSYYRPVMIDRELVTAYAEAVASPGGRHALLETARRIIPKDMDRLIASYPRISCPTFVLWGDHDPLVPVQLGRKLSAQIPGAASRMVVLKDCGHIPQEEMPERTAELIGDFLLRLSPHVL